MTVEINRPGPDVWEQSVFTTAPDQAVFAYIADFEKHVEREHLRWVTAASYWESNAA